MHVVRIRKGLDVYFYIFCQVECFFINPWKEEVGQYTAMHTK